MVPAAWERRVVMIRRALGIGGLRFKDGLVQGSCAVSLQRIRIWAWGYGSVISEFRL